MSVQLGTPIIRPLWWIDNSDPINFRIDDEFLVGNEILVAPITDENKYERDIYFPKGEWIDPTNNQTYVGPKWINGYKAPIDKIPYFKAN